MLGTGETSGGPPPEHEVLPGTWALLSAEGILFTGNVQTCIGVSIHSPDDKLAFLGHFDDPSIEAGNFTDMLETAMAQITAMDNVQIWVGGGEIIDPGASGKLPGDWPKGVKNPESIIIANEETERRRGLITGSLHKFTMEGAQLSTTWLTNSLATLYYSLDASSGKQTIVVTKDTVPKA